MTTVPCGQAIRGPSQGFLADRRRQGNKRDHPANPCLSESEPIVSAWQPSRHSWCSTTGR